MSWFCLHCKLDSGNKAAAATHIYSKHASLLDEGDRYIWSCTTCRSSCASEDALHGHMDSVEHRNKQGEALQSDFSLFCRLTGSCLTVRSRGARVDERAARAARAEAAEVAAPMEVLDAGGEAFSRAVEAAAPDEFDLPATSADIRLEFDLPATSADICFDGMTDEEALQKGVSQVGAYRVVTPREVHATLLASGTAYNTMLPNQESEFNRGANNVGLLLSQRKWVLEHCAKFASCKAPECTGSPCSHFPTFEEMPDNLLVRVPMIFDSENREVVAIWILPGQTIINSWLGDATIAGSILCSPLQRSAELSGNASFCAGTYFSHLVDVVPNGALPLCIACYSDSTSVVGMGTRACHVASVAILNSSQPTLATVRPVMFLPCLKLLPNVGVAQMRRLKLLLFHSAWEAVAQTFGVQIGAPVVPVWHAAKQSFVALYPVVSLFLADTPEANDVQGHRNGALTAEICYRCRATTEENDFTSFALRMDRKKETDEVLRRIVQRERVTEARAALKGLSVLEVLPFTDRLRHFDAALCCPTCSLHVGRILWTRTLIELVGASCAPPTGAEPPAAKRKGEEDVISSINQQFRFFFPNRKCNLFEANGKLDLPTLTGKDWTELATMLPFILFNQGLEELERAAASWIQCLRLWLRPGKSVEQLAELSASLKSAREMFVRLSESVGRDSPFSRPTFHALLHPPDDQLMFGDDCVTTTQEFEQSHKKFAKVPFQHETNKTLDDESLSLQTFKALYQNSFQARAPVLPPAAIKKPKVGLVSRAAGPLSELVTAFTPWEGLVAVRPEGLIDAVSVLVRAHGKWDAMTAPVGMTTKNAPLHFFHNLPGETASAYRLESGVVVRRFEGKAMSNNCIVEMAGETFALVFVIGGLACALLPKRPLLYCKRLQNAYRHGPICSLHRVPLLMDTDVEVAANQILVLPSEIVRVWSAVTVLSRESDNQYVFAVPRDDEPN